MKNEVETSVFLAFYYTQSRRRGKAGALKSIKKGVLQNSPKNIKSRQPNQKVLAVSTFCFKIIMSQGAIPLLNKSPKKANYIDEKIS